MKMGRGRRRGEEYKTSFPLQACHVYDARLSLWEVKRTVTEWLSIHLNSRLTLFVILGCF